MKIFDLPTRAAVGLLLSAVFVVVALTTRVTHAADPIVNGIRVEPCENDGLCRGKYIGYVGVRGPIKENNNLVWVERKPDGTQNKFHEATGPYEKARPMSAQDAAAQIERYTRYAGFRLMSRDEYAGTTFRNSKTNLPIPSPFLMNETTHVSVLDAAQIENPEDIVIFQYSLDPRRAAPSPPTGTLLLDEHGVELGRTTDGTFNYMSDFISSRGGAGRSVICGGPIGDLVTFEQCPLKNLNLVAPLRNVKVDASSHWNFGDAEVTTDSTGRYVLDYTYASYVTIEWGRRYSYMDYRFAGDVDLLYGTIGATTISFSKAANPVDNFWVYMRYNKLDPRIKLGGTYIETRQTEGGKGEVSKDTQHIGIEVAMLVGTGILYNEPRGERWAGEVAAGPVPIDDTSDRTAYAYMKPPAPPAPEPNEPPVEPVPDLKDRGLLQQINRTDLSNTDVYVFDLAGNLLTERNGLKANETDGLVCATPTQCTLPAGDYQARFNFQGIVSNPGFDERFKIVVVNRATGYIGTGFATKRGTELPLIAAERDIVLRPPNLTIRLQRTRKDQHKNLIGFEGSALLSDAVVQADILWTDWDGTPLPAQLPGYTGRIARVVEPNRLAADIEAGGSSGSGLFSITPGLHTTYLKIPNQSDLAHLYLHVSGTPIQRNPDFSELTDGASSLQYRPSHYVPFKVFVFENPGDLSPDENLDAYYVDVYRPEHHFSLLDLKARNVDIVTDDSRTNILENPGAMITGDVNSIEFIYNLIDPDNAENNPLPELERHGQDRKYVISVGGVDKEVTIGIDGSIIWEAGEFGGDIQTDDLVGIRLVQAGDEGNILEEYGLRLTFRVTPDIAEGQRMISADEALGEVEGEVMIGFTPVDPKTVVHWEFSLGGGGLSTPTSETDEDGMAAVTFDTSRTAKSTYEITGSINEVIIKGKKYTLDPPYRATTSTFMVVPGTIPLDKFSGSASRPNGFPADGTTRVGLTVTMHDYWGNAPLDGTPATWSLDGFGAVEGQPTIENGAAHAEFIAPAIPSRPKVRVTVNASRSPAFELKANTVLSNLSPSANQIQLGSSNKILLTARFKDTDEHPVAEGTPVYWTQTNGTLSWNGDSEFVSRTNAEGIATAEFSAPKGTNLGPSRVIATVASTTANSPLIEVVSSSDNTMRLAHTALVFKPGAYVVEEPNRTIFSESLVGVVEPIPVHTETPIIVTGLDGQRPKFTLQELGIGPLLTIDGLDPDGKITIGPDKKPTRPLKIKRRPEAAFFPSVTEGLPDAPAYALMCMDLDADGTCEMETKIGVFAEDVGRNAGSFVWGFATGQGDDVAAMAGDFASSWSVYGDARDLTITGLQLYHIVPGEPNPVVASMSAMSLLPIPVLNEATGVVKLLAKRLPKNGHLLAMLVEMVTKMNRSATEAIRIWGARGPFVKALLLLDDATLDGLGKVMKDQKGVDVLASLYKRCGLRGADLNPLGEHLLKRIAAVATDPNFESHVAEYVAHTLNAMDEKTLLKFVSLTTQEMDEVVGSLSKMAKTVDPAEIGQALSNKRIFGPGYTEKHLLNEVGELADVPGINDSIKMLKVDANQVHGFKYEIQVAAALKRNPPAEFRGCSVAALTVRGFASSALEALTPLKTDIDIMMDCGGRRVAVQVKRGTKALGSLDSVKRWLKRAGPAVGGRANAVYIVPPGTVVKDEIRKFLYRKPKVPIIRVPELNPFN